MGEKSICDKIMSDKAMRIYRSVVVAIMVVATCALLTGCTLSPEGAIGYWQAKYTEGGSSYVDTIALSDRNEYGRVVYKDGEFIIAEIGTYTLKDNVVTLIKDGQTDSISEYEYTGGKLVNNGHKFTKTNEESVK